jgi:hypothetical protein
VFREFVYCMCPVKVVLERIFTIFTEFLDKLFSLFLFGTQWRTPGKL